MTDIVKRLRQVHGDNEDAREAADKIERLRADYSILKGDYDALREDAREAADKIERLRAAIEQAINSLQKDIRALQELRAKLLQ